MENNQEKCPFCNSDKVRQIMYGLIRFETPEKEKEFTEKYVLGGCNVSEYNPNFYCDSCKKSFGAKTEKIPGTIVKPLTMKPADRKIVFGKKNNKK